MNRFFLKISHRNENRASFLVRIKQHEVVARRVQINLTDLPLCVLHCADCTTLKRYFVQPRPAPENRSGNVIDKMFDCQSQRLSEMQEVSLGFIFFGQIMLSFNQSFLAS